MELPENRQQKTNEMESSARPELGGG